jgi:hypothetical protein
MQEFIGAEVDHDDRKADSDDPARELLHAFIVGRATTVRVENCVEIL